MPRLKETWVIPQFLESQENLWVVLATAYLGRSKMVRTLRVFTFEPAQTLVEHQRSVLKNQLDTADVAVEVFAVAADFFDAGEADLAGQ